MDKRFKDKMKNKLLVMKSDILRNLIAENNDFRAAVEDIGVKDLADIASNDIDARTLEAVGAQERMRLTRVEAALSRLENGKFGICASCGVKVGTSRLEAIPYAVLCIDCQQATERRKGR